MKKMKYIWCTLLMFSLASCVEQSIDTVDGEGKKPISLSATYPVNTVSRVTENGFVAGDEVGIFIVDYDASGNPGEPALKGNRGSNVRFKFDGEKWSAPYQLYWADDKTPADFYGYYPFDESMTSVTEYFFSIQSSQNGSATSTSASGYEQSDLLWTKATRVSPTVGTVDLRYRHLMAGITVNLKKGEGFTDEEWNNFEKTVQIENTILKGVVNMKTGGVSVSGDDVHAITPMLYNGSWRAVVYPQSVEAGKSLISITVDGQSYHLIKNESMVYTSGKMHEFEIVVKRSESGGEYEFKLANQGIKNWIDDADLHDGLIRQYTIVHVDEPGTLKQKLEENRLDFQRVISLKVEGELNATDMEFMGQQMTSLANVNLQQAVITDGVVRGFANHPRLTHFVFPQKGVTRIENRTFYKTPLIGSVHIPEGVTQIGEQAYAECRLLTGNLSLPTTLKRIEQAAFSFASLSGQLILPDGIEFIGSSAFRDCKFEGSLYLPESLTVLPILNSGKLTGSVTIPRNITVIDEETFVNSGFSQVEFHDGITEIKKAAFADTQLAGELVLPSNLKQLGGHAFKNTKITNIIFPDALQIMLDGGNTEEGIFSECNRITGTIQFAKNVSRIPKGCFCDCSSMAGIILPENVEIIDEKAFQNCYSLNRIVCENPEPPVVCKDAFFGVPKDNFTLEVPEGSVEKYKNAEGWKEFSRIAAYGSFVCRPSQVNALNKERTQSLVLNADGDWTVESCPEWCTVSPMSGSGKADLQLTIKQLQDGSENRSDVICFKMNDGEYRTYCTVSQYNYEYEEDECISLWTQVKGYERSNNILFLGDGFDSEDISNGTYLNLVKKQMEYFFGIEPYKSHKDYFNVYVAFPLSQEKGVNTMNTYVNNRFGTLYGYDGTIATMNQLLTETGSIYDYALSLANKPLDEAIMKESLIILIPNSSDYNGVTYYADKDLTVSICPPTERAYPQDMRGVVQHEAGGHGFGKLGDEEIIFNKWAPMEVIADIEEKHSKHPSLGWYQNLATTSNANSVSWKDFIFDERYSGEVDVFEGGAGYMRGVFRSESNSCMNYGIPYYNVASRHSIMQRIIIQAEGAITSAYFYENDSKEWGEADSRAVLSVANSYGGSSLHRAPTQVNMKQMDNAIKRIRQTNKIKQEQSINR